MKYVFGLLLFLASSNSFAGTVDVAAVVNWVSHTNTRWGDTIHGTTTDGKPCELDTFNQTLNNSPQFYLSLGTSPKAGDTNENDYSWIGTFINPSLHPQGTYTVNDMEVTAQTVHVNVTQTEAGVTQVIQEDLVIQLDSQNNPVRVIGTSSYWPSSTCVLQLPSQT